MSSKKEKKTVTNTVTSTNGVHEKEPENPQEMELEEQQKDTLKTKLDNVKAERGDFPAVHFAAKKSDVEVCRHLVEQEGADVNEKCRRSGATPLHYAAMNETHGDALIDYLIEKRCDLSEKDYRNKRAIDYALKVGNFNIAIKLFQLSQSHLEPENRWSLLRFSIRKNHLKFAKFVSKDDMKFRKDPEYDLEILLTACMYGELAIIKWLFEDIEIHVRWIWGDGLKNKILCHAAANRYRARDILQYLFSVFQLSSDEQRNAFGNALVSAIQGLPFNAVKAEEFIQLLGSNVRLKISGFTLMHHAAKNSVAALEFVHNKDASLINEVSDDGATVLHLAAMFGNVDMCRWLIDHEQDIYAVNKNNDGTFLHYAAQNVCNGDVIIKKFGRKLRDIVNQIDKYLYTPLHWVLVSKYSANKNAKALLSYGADLSVRKKGNNFLHFCIVKGKLKSAKFVHAMDKDLIKQRGEGGKTTLHLAADHFNEKICLWLVSEGADPRETTVGGKTVLESTCSEEAKMFLRSLITTKK